MSYIFYSVSIILSHLFDMFLAGDTFLEGLLTNGWLSRLAVVCGHVEKSIATWAFNLSE